VLEGDLIYQHMGEWGVPWEGKSTEPPIVMSAAQMSKAAFTNTNGMTKLICEY
jgi:hypothetical protein